MRRFTKTFSLLMLLGMFAFAMGCEAKSADSGDATAAADDAAATMPPATQTDD